MMASRCELALFQRNDIELILLWILTILGPRFRTENQTRFILEVLIQMLKRLIIILYPMREIKLLKNFFARVQLKEQTAFPCLRQIGVKIQVTLFQTNFVT